MKIKLLIIWLLLITLNLYPLKVYANSAIGNGINYLGTQLNGATGQITGGSSGDASPWAAIAFSSNGIDPTTVKTSTNAPSLIDYLKNNHPTATSAATEWEKWILAITAAGLNPYNFGGVNYVSTLESSTYYNNSQIGDTTSVTDDWFGVLALISSGVDKTDPILTNSLSFILTHQNCDGGFGYSTTAGSDGNDTAAAIQALVDAKNYGIVNPKLDAGISNAKAYLLSTQDKGGGFLYDTNPWTSSPDSDSTTWALMALNVLGMQNSTQANSAKEWLTASPQQSTTDGGFTACNQWDPSTFACTGVGSNSTTTSHALIGLAGKGWATNVSINSLLNLPDAQTSCSVVTPTSVPSVVPTVTPDPTSTLTPMPTSTQDTSSNSSPTPTPTSTPVSAANPSTSSGQGSTVAQDSGQIVQTIYTPTPIQLVPTDIPSSSPIPTQEVLGASTVKENTNNSSNGQMALVFSFLGIGAGSLGVYGFKKFKNF